MSAPARVHVSATIHLSNESAVTRTLRCFAEVRSAEVFVRATPISHDVLPQFGVAVVTVSGSAVVQPGAFDVVVRCLTLNEGLGGRVWHTSISALAVPN